MKTKILLSAIALFTVNAAFSQDTTSLPPQSKITFKDKPQTQSGNVTFKKNLNKRKKGATKMKKDTIMYRDTRLGSSSPKYNTYKKNDYGAGAVTTNPNKIKTSKEPRVIFLPVDSSKIKQ